MSQVFDAVGEFERLHVHPRPGRTLIVGSYITEGKEDRRALYEDVVGVDIREGPGVDWVADLEHAHLGTFDHIECRSVLEHTKRPWKMAENLERMMRTDATIYVAVPFVWRPHQHPGDFWRFTVDALPILFPSIDWAARVYASERMWEAGKMATIKSPSGHPYHARTEVLAFGTKVE